MEPQRLDQQMTYEQNDRFGTGIRPKTLSNMESNEPRKYPYPIHVLFIIGNEFCERFNYYGMRTILVLYLTKKLGYTDNDATVLYHGFAMMVYLMCIFGGIISDVWLGKFKTIFFLSIVYSLGSSVVAISAIPAFISSAKVILIIGLILIAVGSGGIKPCVAAFGGDQFKLPEQAAQVATYFSLFYFAINSGSLLSTTFTPILKADVHCFGQGDCFPLAFGVPAVLMVTSLVLFLVGSSMYTYAKTSSENMLLRVSQCVTNAISTKIREGRTNPRKNLLDYSIDKYGEKLVNDTRALLRILLLYLPVPLFWALFEQIASRWTLQADKMDGDLGFYKIEPDQMQVLNPLLVLIFIPLFEFVIYPILNMVGIRRPLQRLAMGGILAGVAFLITAFVQLRIEAAEIENPPINEEYQKTVSIFWLLPQYIVMTMGEIMFSVTGLAFSYQQAPESMKSVVQAIWQLTVAIGNLIVLSIAKAQIFDKGSKEFFLFAGLMFLDMLIFMVLAYYYKSGTPAKVESEETNDVEHEISLKTFEEKTTL